MKKLLCLILSLMVSITIYAQAPNLFNYQGVARDLSGNPIINQSIGLRITILQGSASGSEVYKETFTITTNNLGLFNIQIGGGTPVTGSISAINWSNATYYLKIEMDGSGGSSYQFMGTSQLISVPYSLHSKTAESLIGGIVETDPVYGAAPAHGITGTNINNWNAAFGWGNHSGLYRPIAYVPAWGEITSNPFSFVSNANNQLLKFNSSSNKWENWTPNFVTTIGDQSIAGNKTFTGSTSFNNTVVTNVANPVSTGDAVNKAYVDELYSIIQDIQNGVKDVDGNTYKVVLIGKQLWMAENLRTTKFSDGTEIPYVTGDDAWAAIVNTPAYGWQNNNIALKSPYGGLYSWYTVDNASNGNKNPCPVGWHVPSSSEFQALIDYLGGADIAGGKLKEAGTTHWSSPNTGATNESGFTALPFIAGDPTVIWSASGSSGNGFYLYMNTTSDNAGMFGNIKRLGYSVRCLKD